MVDKTQGIIDPPIDELLSKVDSKYALEGSLFDNVGPLVDSTIDDKPLSVAMHEINEDKLIATPIVEPAAS
jgi:DNA-directed RNA polymerase subunit omega